MNAAIVFMIATILFFNCPLLLLTVAIGPSAGFLGRRDRPLRARIMLVRNAAPPGGCRSGPSASYLPPASISAAIISPTAVSAGIMDQNFAGIWVFGAVGPCFMVLTRPAFHLPPSEARSEKAASYDRRTDASLSEGSDRRRRESPIPYQGEFSGCRAPPINAAGTLGIGPTKQQQGRASRRGDQYHGRLIVKGRVMLAIKQALTARWIMPPHYRRGAYNAGKAYRLPP